MQSRRVLDEATRRRRQRKALEALEADNFQDDPHSDLRMSKKAPKFEESMEIGAPGTYVTYTFPCNFYDGLCLFFSEYVDVCVLLQLLLHRRKRNECEVNNSNKDSAKILQRF